MSVPMPLEKEAAAGAGRSHLGDAPRVRARAGGRRALIAALAVSLALGAVAVRLQTGRTDPPLPVLGTLAPFGLTDETGGAFGSAELAGQTWIAGFIFTRCPTVCPATSTLMAKMQDGARGLSGIRLVSFSVDPTFDRPAVLRRYAERYDADPRWWKFVTGDLGAVEETVTNGLKIALGDVSGEQDLANVSHGTHFVLVDGARRIRGYYASSDSDVVAHVLRDASRVAKEGGTP